MFQKNLWLLRTNMQRDGLVTSISSPVNYNEVIIRHIRSKCSSVGYGKQWKKKSILYRASTDLMQKGNLAYKSVSKWLSGCWKRTCRLTGQSRPSFQLLIINTFDRECWSDGRDGPLMCFFVRICTNMKKRIQMNLCNNIFQRTSMAPSLCFMYVPQRWRYNRSNKIFLLQRVSTVINHFVQ